MWYVAVKCESALVPQTGYYIGEKSQTNNTTNRSNNNILTRAFKM